MKRLCIYATFTFIVGIVQVWASFYGEVDGICYRFDTEEKEAWVYAFRLADPYNHNYHTDYYSGEVMIPESVTFDDVDYTVTRIGPQAFSECRDLTAVYIPMSITSIGGRAFYGCSSLTQLVIPKSVTSVGTYVCEGCTSLKEVLWEAPTIPEYTFSRCTSLTSINLSTTVKSINRYAIKDAGLTTLVLPDNVTSIESYSIWGCKNLKNLSIGAGIQHLPEYTIVECPGLTSITISPENPIYDSRENCNAVIETKTNTLLFGSCASMIPENVTQIAKNAFRGMKLSNIKIPQSVTAIGYYAFALTDLHDINIPNSVQSIGIGAFAECYNLRTAILPEALDTLQTQVFMNCDLRNVVLPDKLLYIGDFAFSGNRSLNRIIIPNNVTYIGTEAFSGCSLQNIISRSQHPSKYQSAFSDDAYNHAILYVPETTTGKYVYRSEWGNFNSIREYVWDKDNVKEGLRCMIADPDASNFATWNGIAVLTTNFISNTADSNGGNYWQVRMSGTGCCLYNQAAAAYASIDENGVIGVSALPQTLDIEGNDGKITINGVEKLLVICDEDRTDNIEGAETSTLYNDAIYDLGGRRVRKTQKGIYIKDSRKVVLK